MFVPKIVLRNGARPDGVANEHGFTADTEQLLQIRADAGEELVERQRSEFWLPAAADHHGQRNMVVRRAFRKDRGREQHAKYRPFFRRGHQHAESVEWMADLITSKAEEE